MAKNRKLASKTKDTVFYTKNGELHSTESDKLTHPNESTQKSISRSMILKSGIFALGITGVVIIAIFSFQLFLNYAIANNWLN